MEHPIESRTLKYKINNDRKGTLVANIYYNEAIDEYSAELIDEDDTPILFWQLVGEIFSHENIKLRRNPESKYILAWLKDRVIPENRDMLKEILAANGLYEYDWRELIKLNHGRTTDDYYSVETIGG